MGNEGKSEATFELVDEEEGGQSVFQRTEAHVQSTILDGLIELLPVIISIAVIIFIIGLADGWVRHWPFVSGRLWDFPGIGIVVMGVILYLVGLLIRTRLGRSLMSLKDAIFSHVPVVKNVFGVAQRATTTVTSELNFTRVVFLEWTQPGVVALGFVTGRAYRDKKPESNADEPQSMVIVYVPTVPNPTSGNLALVMEDDVIETDLSVEDAMKLVFSGGIVLPDSVALARMPRVRGEREFIDRFTIESN